MKISKTKITSSKLYEKNASIYTFYFHSSKLVWKMGIKSGKVQGRMSIFDEEGRNKDWKISKSWFRSIKSSKKGVSLSKTAVSHSIFEQSLCSLRRKLRFFMVNLQFERKQFLH